MSALLLPSGAAPVPLLAPALHQLPGGTLQLHIERSDCAAHELFLLAARNNPRRAFLFVSRVLAKHLPVAPSVVQDCHERIAQRVGAQPGPVLFIGMAETATGLGQGVFEAWQRQHPGTPALYLHTSRYRAVGAQALAFEESHSHAPQVFLHVPTDPLLHAQFVAARALVLVDDEISTGNTFVHLAHTCLGQAPGIERVHLASITDFCGPARAGLSARMGRPVSSGALLEGAWSFTPHGNPGSAPEAAPAQAALGQEPFFHDSGFGRLGRSGAVCLSPAALAPVAAGISAGERVLVLGTGEFMHPAFVLGRALVEQTGACVRLQSTTRSPILPWGPITHTERFDDPYGEGIANYLYNFTRSDYDHVLLCHEAPPSAALQTLARRWRARLVHFISEDHLAQSAFC
ncbi:MAG: phosphoribosyltransferase domain-containing protein [Simplicispira sp.]|nr:phosphoribosyltransferase domain-containing protein [Simplicispira sp.]